jgi:hypothetical protein
MGSVIGVFLLLLVAADNVETNGAKSRSAVRGTSIAVG